jgi:hypothetical protein
MYPEARVRVRDLLATGHSHMDYAPFVRAFAGAVLFISLLVAVADSARGVTVRTLPPWEFALLPPLALTLQEHVEQGGADEVGRRGGRIDDVDTAALGVVQPGRLQEPPPGHLANRSRD